ncbi:MAG: hypothetical protein WA005_12495 [Candidatus Binataceae bacterium]
MPVTISYDLVVTDNNQWNYVRSMLERFGWQRLGGSVFRYPRRGQIDEDWLNDVIPSLMFLRSYVLKNSISIKYFTIDASSISMIDLSDPNLLFGEPPRTGPELSLKDPTNDQSAAKTIRDFVDAAIKATT